jgi:hypothetical protein
MKGMKGMRRRMRVEKEQKREINRNSKWLNKII